MYIYYASTLMVQENPFWMIVHPGICQYGRHCSSFAKFSMFSKSTRVMRNLSWALRLLSFLVDLIACLVFHAL